MINMIKKLIIYSPIFNAWLTDKSADIREGQAVHMTVSDVYISFTHSAVHTSELAGCINDMRNDED